jgi:ribosomal-protein-alanine N-acetyltransferase
MLAAMPPLPGLATPRLVLHASDVALAPAVADYLRRNREAHARWNPPAPEAFFSAEGQAERLTSAVRAEGEGREIGWWLALHEAPGVVIGSARLSQIARGPFCSAMLGYAIDQAHEGRGLMREALQAVLADAFGARVGLHRVQANARVENLRSLALLDRLGFEREGLAREYLFIDGAWRDHVLTALRHPGWPADRPPT